MADKKEQAHATYLVNPDTGRVELVHGDDVASKAGWKQPTGQRANGADWNAEDEQAIRDAAADQARIAAKASDKKAAEQNAVHDASVKEAEKQAEIAEQTPDFKVQVVTPPKKAASKPAAAKKAKR